MNFSLVEIWDHLGAPAIAVAVVLLAMGLVSLVAFLERLVTLRRSRAESHTFAAHASMAVEELRFDEISRLASSHQNGYLARIVGEGVKFYLHAVATAASSGSLR